ncbi:MAG: hypothetical protein LIO53_06975 [Oscillospiraceae bacterium]|nr:hypothetical protein [Oscillospiraceae bacterium]
MTYGYLKKIIAKGNYDADDLMNKLDVFLLAGRITDEQYKELSGLINTTEG